MKQLWMLIVLLALPLISSADNEIRFVTCQFYVDSATRFMDAINAGWSVSELGSFIRGQDYSADLSKLNNSPEKVAFAALELAAKFNYLNIGDSHVGYDFIRDAGMALCLDADGDPTQIVLP